MRPISETYRYIVRSAGVRSGNPIVEGTRIAVHDVIGLLQNGETVDTLTANCFPQLTRSQVYECLAYYEDHRGEIDLLVARQMAPASEGSSCSITTCPTISATCLSNSATLSRFCAKPFPPRSRLRSFACDPARPAA